MPSQPEQNAKPVVEEMTLTQRVKAAMEMIKRVQRTEEIRFMCNDAVPIDLEGSMLLPEIPEREFVTDYLDEKMIDREFLDSHLFSLLQDFMQGLQAQDYSQLHQIAEKNFVDKLQLQRQKAPDSEWFDFSRLKYDPVKVACVDRLFIKGVGIERDTNADQMDYTRITSLESNGLRQYVHKFELGMQPYYYQQRYEKELRQLVDGEWRAQNPMGIYETERVVREGWHKMRTEIMAKQFRYLLRVTLQLKQNCIGEIDYAT